jgi:integrase
LRATGRLAVVHEVPTPAFVGSGRWTEALMAEVRAEFRVQRYVADPADPVLFGLPCGVANCLAPRRYTGEGKRLGLGSKMLCSGHYKRLQADPPADFDSWLAEQAPLAQINFADCAVPSCARSSRDHGLCRWHDSRWIKDGRPFIAPWAETQPPGPTSGDVCSVSSCMFPLPARGRAGLCDAHARRFHLRRALHEPDLDVAGYIEWAFQLERERYTPVFDLSGLPPLVTLELQYYLQARHDASHSGRLAVFHVRKLVEFCREREGLQSLFGAGEALFDEFLLEHKDTGTAAVGRDVWRHLKRFHRRAFGIEFWDEDVWPKDELPRTELDPDPGGISWAAIQQNWLRELAKRWGKHRITVLGLSSATVAMEATTLRKFSRWAGDRLADPENLNRAMLEDFAAFLATTTNSNRSRTIGQMRVFLDGVRQLQWEPRIPANATYLRGEGGKQREPAPRFISEDIMQRIEDRAAIERIPDEAVRLGVILLIECGLRAKQVRLLDFDPIRYLPDGAPVLAYLNHKAGRDAFVPLSQWAHDEIRAQQERVRVSFAHVEQPPLLLPARNRNPVGDRPMSYHMLRHGILDWLEDLGIEDPSGNVTPHRFRHTLGTRLINEGMSEVAIQQLFDHSSPQMTQRYARINATTLRKEWEKYRRRIGQDGTVDLHPEGELGDAAWMRDQLAHARQSLPNGFCALPVKFECPHANKCLSCSNFYSDTRFIDVFQQQRKGAVEMLERAEANGWERAAEGSRRDVADLDRWLASLQAEAARIETELGSGAGFDILEIKEHNAA